jgi:hypothetical protein
MRIDSTTWLVAGGALGAAALVFAFLPGAWPNPLPAGDLLGPAAWQPLRAAAVAVDAACQRGDLAAFAAATTSEHRDALQQALDAVDRALDRRALLELARVHTLAAWFDQPVLGGRVVGNRAALVLARSGEAGGQLLAFAWDGQRLRLAACRHLPRADAASIERALRRELTGE